MKKIVSFVLLVFTICISYLIWWSQQQDKIHFIPAFLAGQLFSVITFFLLSWRTKILVNNQISWPIALKSTGVTLVTSLLTPAKLSDFATKPYYLNKTSQIPYPVTIACVVKERIWDLLALALLCMSIPFITKQGILSEKILNYGMILSAIGLTSLFILLVLPSILKKIRLPKIIQPFVSVLLDETIKQKLSQLILALCIWIFSVLMLYYFYNYSGLPFLPFDTIILVFIASVLGLIVTISPGGIGTYEAAMAGIFVLFKLNWQDAIAIAIGFRFCWLAIPLLVFLYALMNDGTSLFFKRSDENV